MLATLACLTVSWGALPSAMFGYNDDDEEALRNSLPEYQRNASLLDHASQETRTESRAISMLPASILTGYSTAL